MKKTTSFLILLVFSGGFAYAQTNTWTGAQSNDWHSACNWSLNQIPACTHDVVIPSAPANQPRVTGIAHSRTIDVATGANLDINVAGGGIVHVSSTNGGVCGGTPLDNSAGGCCTTAQWVKTMNPSA